MTAEDRSDELLDWYAEDDDDDQPTLPADDYGTEIEYPGPEAPFHVAEQLYKKFRRGKLRTLRAYRGGWMYWRTTHWSELDSSQLRGHVYQELSKAWYWKMTKEGPEKANWNPNRHKAFDVLDAMQAHGYLPLETDPPAWLSTSAVGARTSADQTISCENGLLDLTSRTVNPHTPAFFNLVTVPLAYQPDATAPRWLEFLDSLWPGDPQSIALLQEYMGYVLSGRTDLQKMLVMVGPIRSGKGTIARVLVQLLGRGHVCGPTLASLATNFGLAPLLGKPLAIVSDARLGNMPGHLVVERLLSITGEDMLTVDRKYREQWSGKLPTRFVILTNELPKFRDSSGAIASRMLILQMTNSFYGKENLALDDELRAELPGILNWALEGLQRLGRFTQPKSSDDAVRLMADLASPISAFVRDECDLTDAHGEVLCDDLFTAWKTWAEENGHHPGAKSGFGRDLHSVVPRIKVIRPGAGNSRERKYVGIKLIGQPSTAHNAVLFGRLGRDDETAGQQGPGVGGDLGRNLDATDHVQDRVQDRSKTISDETAGQPVTSKTSKQNSIVGPTRSERNGKTDGYGHPPMCPGCGIFYVNAGYHRGDCTASKQGGAQ